MSIDILELIKMSFIEKRRKIRQQLIQIKLVPMGACPMRTNLITVLDNKWYGPDPILIRSRGAICVFPQNEDNPFWVPERLTRKIQTDQGNTNVPRLGDVQGVNNKERAALGDNVDISTPNDGDV